jgi:hypothetical protein
LWLLEGLARVVVQVLEKLPVSRVISLVFSPVVSLVLLEKVFLDVPRK